MDQNLKARFRDAAQQIEGIDKAVYAQWNKDPLEPIIGEGPPQAPIAIFGRDPGRDEVRHQTPFIGAGGQKVRQALYRHFFQSELPSFAASVQVGRHFFWANTVPYKPIGNKAWSMSIKKQFQPLMAEVLLQHWQGKHIITLGREAFLWFGIGRSKQERLQLDTFWQRDDRFWAHLPWTLQQEGLPGRLVFLHPLPHPSPLNATWYKRFPELLEDCLKRLGAEPLKPSA